MTLTLSEACAENLDLTINNFVNFFTFNIDESPRLSKLFNSLKLIGSIVLLAIIFPAIPFIFVMALTLAIIKYTILKVRNL